MNSKLPLASPGMVDSAEHVFSEYRTMTPEEWAARYSHTVGCSSFDQYRYENEELHQWIHRLHEILGKDVSAYRKKYLTEEEIREIEEDENDPDGF